MRYSPTTSYNHYNDVIKSPASRLLTQSFIQGQIKENIKASLAFVRGIHRRSVNSPHKRPVTRKMFPFDDVNLWCSLVLTIRSFWHLKENFVADFNIFLELAGDELYWAAVCFHSYAVPSLFSASGRANVKPLGWLIFILRRTWKPL